jgi:transcriptional regulator with XRE-family HTH domain
MSKGADLLKNSVLRIMKSKGWNQKELAEALGMKPPHVSRMLSSDASDPRLETVIEIAEALKYQPWELLKPEGALATQPTPEVAIEVIIKALGLEMAITKPQDPGFKRISIQEPEAPPDENKPRLLPPVLDRLRSDIIRILFATDDVIALEDIIRFVQGRVALNDKRDTSRSTTTT